MQRKFYTKHNNKFISECNCYLESHLCPALQGLKYDIKYDRPTNTENIYVQKEDFQKPVFLNHYYCAPEHREPLTQIQFCSYQVGTCGNFCSKEIFSNKPEDIQECAMINKLREHNIPIEFKCGSWALPFLWTPVDCVVEVWIKTDRLDQLHIFDEYSILGTCAGCKWHTPWETHDFAPKEAISCEGCSVSNPAECPATKMRHDGYTECESKIKCVALRHAQFIKEKCKDDHTK